MQGDGSDVVAGGSGSDPHADGSEGDGDGNDDAGGARRAVVERVEAVEAGINDRLPAGLKVGFLTLYWYSRRRSDRLDRLARRSFWARWSDLALASLLVVQVAGVALVGLAAVRALGQPTATALNDPANTVAIPGLNAFMPLAATPYVVFGLLVATVVHEGGHALACRAADIDVEEWGLALLLGVVPLAGYVLPGDELDAASRRTRLRVFAIGVFHNLLVTGLALLLLASAVTASPRAAFVEYFGWTVVGDAPPTAATVAALGPLTNAAFWLALLNANFALLNAMPVSVLDGGRVLSLSLAAGSEHTGVALSPRARSLLVNAASVAVVALVVVALFAPLV